MIEDFGTGSFRLHHTALEQGGGLRIDHTAKLGLWVHRVAKADGPCLFGDERDQVIGDTVLNKDPLHGSAALAGIAGGAGNGDGGGLFKIFA